MVMSDVIKFLVEWKRDINIKDREGRKLADSVDRVIHELAVEEFTGDGN